MLFHTAKLVFPAEKKQDTSFSLTQSNYNLFFFFVGKNKNLHNNFLICPSLKFAGFLSNIVYG
jgi:hypothetical protein